MTTYLNAPLASPALTGAVTIAETAGSSALAITGASQTASHPVLSATQTWNSGGTTFTGLKLNVTDSASSASSLLMDLQVGSSAIFSFRKDGYLGSAFTVGAEFLELFATSAAALTRDITNRSAAFFGSGGNGGIWLPADYPIRWTATTAGTGSDALSTPDILLFRDAAGILAQRVTTSAQTLRIYNTYTDSTNYERGGFDWQTTANVFRIRSENNGSGTNRIIAIDGFDKAGAAANTDLPSGTWALVHDTSGATVKLVYNLSGTLKTVTLA